MKKIAIHSVVLLLLVLVAASIAGVFANNAGYASGHIAGLNEGRLAAQRESVTSVSTLMTQGLTVCHDVGRNVRYLLKPVALAN